METEIIDKLFLELAQVTKARTPAELDLTNRLDDISATAVALVLRLETIAETDTTGLALSEDIDRARRTLLAHVSPHFRKRLPGYWAGRVGAAGG